jgi:hypothetical protein
LIATLDAHCNGDRHFHHPVAQEPPEVSAEVPLPVMQAAAHL